MVDYIQTRDQIALFPKNFFLSTKDLQDVYQRLLQALPVFDGENQLLPIEEAPRVFPRINLNTRGNEFGVSLSFERFDFHWRNQTFLAPNDSVRFDKLKELAVAVVTILGQDIKFSRMGLVREFAYQVDYLDFVKKVLHEKYRADLKDFAIRVTHKSSAADKEANHVISLSSGTRSMDETRFTILESDFNTPQELDLQCDVRAITKIIEAAKEKSLPEPLFASYIE